jgi:signal transduction histidine kinase
MKHKILIVDDRPENTYSLECMLMDDEREILKAGSGEEALKIAFREELSLILLDVQMPEMDGFEVARMLKSTKKTRKIPIVFVTAISKEKKYMLKGLNEGAVDYLFKPLDTDVTQAKVNTLLMFYEQQKEIEQINAELMRLNDEKNYFLGVASHDLRNPIGNILTLTTLIQQGEGEKLSGEYAKYLDVIVQTSSNMLELLNNLLDVSRIESGKHNLSYSTIQLLELIQDCLNDNRLHAEKKSIQLSFSLPESAISFEADTMQLKQVLNNLLSNAIKYSKPGKLVEVTAEEKDGRIIIHVIDQGQGIPEQEQAKVFKPFVKTSVRTTGGESSNGLGLAIAQRIVEAHGGQITLQSTVGVGTRFSVSLPLSRAMKNKPALKV